MARDPYKYFRIEARELLDGLVPGALHLEKAASPETAARLLRLAHTLKGAARIVKEAGIAELAHKFEDVLAPHRETGGPLPAADASALLALLDGVAARLAALDPAPASQAPAPANQAVPAVATVPTPSEPPPIFRVEMDDIDALLRGVHEAGVQLGAVRSDLVVLDRARDLAGLLRDQLARSGEPTAQFIARASAVAEALHADLTRVQRGVTVDVERAEGEFAELRDVAHRLRLIPARSIFSSLDRAVRDAAHDLARRVEFTTSGGDERLDASVLAALRDALAHVVRNAVVHGAETEAERSTRGKPPVARVHLAVERRRSSVAFTCSDDGRGVDLAAVRLAAVARGRIDPATAASLSERDTLALLRGGVTTAGSVSELAGRGIGMDVVRATAERLRGTLELRSEASRGATIEIQVPISLAALEGLVVEAAGEPVTIPLAAVRRTMRVAAADVAHASERDVILHDDNVVPFAPLADLLRRRDPTRDRSAWIAVLVQAGEHTAAIGVDRMLGTAAVVLHAIPSTVTADPVVAGASFDAEGNPRLVLDPEGLIAAASSRRGASKADPATRPAPVLVVDDSLTTRMLEQAILEAAGYVVDLAVSAEDALARARERHYGLFIVDVEMPGMSGFEFTTRTRADPGLRDTPVILVTSLSTPEDRRRGHDAGASAYIVKGEFDQRLLLQTIRGLIG